ERAVRLRQPVDEVGPPRGAGIAEVRRLVARVAGGAEPRLDLRVERGLLAVLRPRVRARERRVAERRAGLGDEAVRGHVLGAELERAIERRAPALHRVPGV